MYKILIKDSKNGSLFRYLTVKQEIMEEHKETVTDDDTQEVKEVTTYVGTGTYETVEYVAKNMDELEKKCIELLSSYKVTEFTPVKTLNYTPDLVWSEDSKETL